MTEPSIKKCTSVNKRKKKRNQVVIMKEYRQVPAAVELVGYRKARVRASLPTEGCGPQRPLVEQHQPRYGWSAAMVKKRSLVNITVCPCFHSSLTHNRNINPFENKVWDIYIFIKKCVHSFIEVWIMLLLIFVLRYTTVVCIWAEDCVYVFPLIISLDCFSFSVVSSFGLVWDSV